MLSARPGTISNLSRCGLIRNARLVRVGFDLDPGSDIAE